MGLKWINLGLVLVASLILVGCMAKDTVIIHRKKYIACCDPGLNADDKAICKWMHERGITKAQDFSGNLYEGVWQDCEPGKEPWRKWE